MLLVGHSLFLHLRLIFFQTFHLVLPSESYPNPEENLLLSVVVLQVVVQKRLVLAVIQLHEQQLVLLVRSLLQPFFYSLLQLLIDEPRFQEVLPFALNSGNHAG